MARHRLIAGRIAWVFAGLFLAACSHNSRMEPVEKAWVQGDYAGAAQSMEPLLKEYDLKSDNAPINGVIYSLEGGAVLQAAGQLESSVAEFNEAYDAIRPYLDSAAETKVTEEAAAAITNQTVRTYRGQSYDRIMMNTYQAINYWRLGDSSKAGVELRRAYEWQKDAIDRNAARIQKEQEAIEKAGSKDGYDSKKTLSDPGFQQKMDAAFGPIRDMRGYANYEIPFASYLRGLSYLSGKTNADLEQARAIFRYVVGLMSGPSAELVKADAMLAENALQGKAVPKMVYVILEAGQSPTLKELRLDIPIFLPNVPYVAAAFPLLSRSELPTTSAFTVDGGAEEPVQSALLTDMEGVVAADYNQRLPGIIVATLVSSAAKAAATYAAKQAAGNYGLVTGIIYQAATNSADLRTWTTLPKQVLWARSVRPQAGKVSVVLADGQRVGPIDVPDSTVSVVHLRQTASGTAPMVSVFPVSR
jgi:hypothetical protein